MRTFQIVSTVSKTLAVSGVLFSSLAFAFDPKSSELITSEGTLTPSTIQNIATGNYVFDPIELSNVNDYPQTVDFLSGSVQFYRVAIPANSTVSLDRFASNRNLRIATFGTGEIDYRYTAYPLNSTNYDLRTADTQPVTLGTGALTLTGVSLSAPSAVYLIDDPSSSSGSSLLHENAEFSYKDLAKAVADIRDYLWMFALIVLIVIFYLAYDRFLSRKSKS